MTSPQVHHRPPPRCHPAACCMGGVDANETSSDRHATIRAHLASQFRQPQGGRDALLIFNVIDHHYAHLLGAWKRMLVQHLVPSSHGGLLSTPPTFYLVTLDGEAAAASTREGIVSFTPTHRNISTACLVRTTHGQQLLSGVELDPYTRRWDFATGAYFAGSFKGLHDDLPSWKLHGVAAAVSVGWRVLLSEADVLWAPPVPVTAASFSHGLGRRSRRGGGDGGSDEAVSAAIATTRTTTNNNNSNNDDDDEVRARSIALELISSSSSTRDGFDLAIGGHHWNQQWNAGFFLAQNERAASWFRCAARSWDRFRLPRCTCPMEVGSEQRHMQALYLQGDRPCGKLSVRKLNTTRVATCRDWVGREATVAVVHVTYCRLLSEWASVEDECKRKIVEAFLHGTVGMSELTSEEWNRGRGC